MGGDGPPRLLCGDTAAGAVCSLTAGVVLVLHAGDLSHEQGDLHGHHQHFWCVFFRAARARVAELTEKTERTNSALVFSKPGVVKPRLYFSHGVKPG